MRHGGARVQAAVPEKPAVTPTHPAPQASDERWVTREVLLVLVTQVLFGLGWSMYLLAPKYMVTVLSAGPEVVGRSSAAEGIASLLTVPFAATGLDRFGRRRFFRVGTGLLLSVSLVYHFVDHVGPLLFVLQGCIAASWVLAFNASAAMITDLAPPSRMGQAIGWLGAANVATNAISTTVAESVADHFGWHAVFYVAAGCASVALGMSLNLPKTSAPVALSTSATPAASKVFDRTFVRMLTASMLVGAVFAAMFSFLQPYAIELGARRLRDFFIGFTIAAVACRVVFGSLGDRLGRRRISALSMLGYALCAFAVTRLDPSWLWAYGLAFGTAHGVLYPTLGALVLEGVPASRRGFGLALYNGAFNIGKASGGLGFGLIAASSGYPPAFALAGTLGLLGVLTVAGSGPRPAAAAA